MKLLKKIYNCLLGLLGCCFPVYRSKRLYKKMTGRKLNITNPQTLNEKLMYKFNLYWKNEVVNRCTDKYQVREYVEKNGLGHLLNEVYGVWDEPEDIEWDKLPERFVLKLNTGSGANIICKDKNLLDKKATIKQLKKWSKKNYGYLTAEQGIYYNQPMKIIAEKYIDNKKNTPPDDFKVFCSYGEVKLLFVACDRYEHKTKFDFYTPDWKWIDVKNCHPNNGPIAKPNNLDSILEYASKLSKPFPLVRVDFYDVNETIIFGEMTFTHMGCIHPFDPDKYDLEFGNLFPNVKDANKILKKD